MPIPLEGSWRIGLAYDMHTVSSIFRGQDEFGRDSFDTQRTEMGELVYQLKYNEVRSNIPKILELLKSLELPFFDCVLSIPPSQITRSFQPVRDIAAAFAHHHRVPLVPDCLLKRPGAAAIKSVDDPDERLRLLKDSMYIRDPSCVAGRCILLIDDVFRSGATLEVATQLLLTVAKAKDVCVLTMTLTRTKR